MTAHEVVGTAAGSAAPYGVAAIGVAPTIEKVITVVRTCECFVVGAIGVQTDKLCFGDVVDAQVFADRCQVNLRERQLCLLVEYCQRHCSFVVIFVDNLRAVDAEADGVLVGAGRKRVGCARGYVCLAENGFVDDYTIVVALDEVVGQGHIAAHLLGRCRVDCLRGAVNEDVVTNGYDVEEGQRVARRVREHERCGVGVVVVDILIDAPILDVP